VLAALGPLDQLGFADFVLACIQPKVPMPGAS